MRLPWCSSVAVALVAAACVGSTALTASIVAGASPLVNGAAIHPNVQRRMETSGVASVVVVMREERPSRLLSLRRLAKSGKPNGCESGLDVGSLYTTAIHDSVGTISDESVETMVERLEAHSAEAHEEVMELLESQRASGSSSSLGSEGTAYSTAKSLWVSNEVVIRDATYDLIDKLASLPSVGFVREEAIAHIPGTTVPYLSEDDSSSADGGIEARQQQRQRRLGQGLVGEWGVERVHAISAWQQGWFGNATRVATIDSGVRLSHSVLRSNFVGDFGWFDALADAATPEDSSGHGTGVMGVLVGGSGLGVAPGATWMACRACDAANDCREGDLLECAQFLTCPYITAQSTANASGAKASQATRNCSARPRVINNSWNLDRRATTFQTTVDVWVAAGIVPVFSAGNAGPGCTTVSAPADASTTSISVGSTDYSDQLSSFSARGPGLDGNIKPDVVAPGETVVSAGHESDSSLVLLSGTSIATPHVSGVVALLAGAYPALTVSGIVQLVQQAASPAIGVAVSANTSCLGDVSSSMSLPVPNNAFGYGMADVSKAITLQQASS